MPRLSPVTLLNVAGLVLLTLGLGLLAGVLVGVLVGVGVGVLAAGVSCLLLAWAAERPDS